MESAIEKIIEKIQKDVNLKVQQFEIEAEQKIEAIKEEEYSRWEAEKNKIEADGRREMNGTKVLKMSRAQLEGRREVTEAREYIIKKIIDDVKRMARTSPGYVEYIKRSIIDAKEVLGERFVVKCIPEDKEKVIQIVSDIAPMSTVEVSIIKYGGIVISTVDSLKTLDYSVDALVNRNLQKIRRMIFNKLFEGEYA